MSAYVTACGGVCVSVLLLQLLLKTTQFSQLLLLLNFSQLLLLNKARHPILTSEKAMTTCRWVARMKTRMRIVVVS